MDLLLTLPSWNRLVSMLILTMALCGFTGMLLCCPLLLCETNIHCSKKHPLDSTRQVLRNAKQLLVETSSQECGDIEEGDHLLHHKTSRRSKQLYRYREADDCIEGSEEPEEHNKHEDQSCKDNSSVQDEQDEDQEDEDDQDDEQDDHDGGPSSSSAALESDPLSSSPLSSSPFSSSPSLSPSPTRGVMMVGGYGVLSLNRVYKDSTELSSNERKKLIFGSDQIKP